MPYRVMHALTLADTVTSTYNVGKQLARKTREQPIHTRCPALVTLKPILISNEDTKSLRARVQFASCVSSSIVQCVAPVKLAHNNKKYNFYSA